MLIIETLISTYWNFRFKKTVRPLVTYLEKEEMDALLDAPDVATTQGRRDHALLLFLYNTGARADEVAHLQIGDLHLGLVPKRDLSWDFISGLCPFTIRGKGNKLRRCPLWTKTIDELTVLFSGRAREERVFLNRCGHPLTRFGIHGLVKRYVAKTTAKVPSLERKRISPHTIRHTTATHLLRSGVDINTIRAWLGHVSLATTNIYTQVDLEAKAKALANCEIEDTVPKKSWRKDPELMEFLRGL